MDIIKKKIKSLKKKLLKSPSVKDICKKTSKPQPQYKDISWVNIAITPDQLRIESVLSELALNNKRLLHVGVGSSSIAKKFTQESIHIDGITVMQEEKDYANSLNLSHYNVYLLNKYSDELNRLNFKYDFIIDNNLSSFACCKQHYLLMIRNYIDMLSTGGVLLTDQSGMNYSEDYAFGIEYKDLQGFEKQFPVKIIKMTESVFSINKL
jgi:hypothetical protein